MKTNLNPACSRGRLFLIVGNSGSGKDSLLAEVLTQWPAAARPMIVPRRYITRTPHDSEPYISVTGEQFERLRRANTFCLSWQAYQIHYGIPGADLEWMNQGRHVAVNVSRTIISRARRFEPDLKVVFVKVPLELTRHRLKSRFRESENDPSFRRRLQRARENQILNGADLIVDNTGSLGAGAKKLRDYMLSFG